MRRFVRSFLWLRIGRQDATTDAPAVKKARIPLNYKLVQSFRTPPIILLPGMLCTSLNWEKHAKRLSHACDSAVYCLDLRNHGPSQHQLMSYVDMAKDLQEFLDLQGVEKATVIGHSMGGKVAMQFALQNPHRISRLVVVDVAPRTYSHLSGLTKFIQGVFPLISIPALLEAN